MECQILFYWKNRKKKIKLSCADFFLHAKLTCTYIIGNECRCPAYLDETESKFILN